MAEAAVNLIIDKLTPLLIQQADLLRGVHTEVQDISDELKSIRSFLKDADARAACEDADESLKTWVIQTRELAFRIEDVVDEYIMHMAATQHQNRGSNKSCFIRFLNKLRRRHKIAAEIQKVKASVLQVKERSKRWELRSTFEPGNGSRLHDPRLGALFVDEAELVGIESPRQELVNQLLQGESMRMVIAMVGMGGLGKTTLIKKVYDHERVKTQFDYRAWINVSQTYDILQLLRSMTRQFYEAMKKSPHEIDAMDEVSLITALRQILQPSKYVVVFDDVWKESFWDEIEYALLDNKNGSRIIMTTRNVDVANFCKKSALLYIHNLQPLSIAMAKELFFKRAFRFVKDRRCPKELEGLSAEIIERCNGLPLAIVAIGGLLSTKGGNVLEWKYLLDNLTSELKRNPHLTRIERILSLSYQDLPFHLKSCLLYIGMFPEDYSVNCCQLRQLWIANGFVKQIEGYDTLEAVSERHLTELINRNLLEVERVKLSGKVKTCQVHDMLREVLISKSKELSFTQVAVENLAHFNGSARHLSIQNISRSSLTRRGTYQTRSVLYFETHNRLQDVEMKSLFLNFKLLNALCFENAPIELVPEELGNLLHLSYLSLRNSNVKVLPKSIGKLHNLETLDVRGTQVTELPVDINSFPKLQYLLMYVNDYDSEFGYRGTKILGNAGNLKDLKKLYSLDTEQASTNWFRQLGELKQLRRLGIKNFKRENSAALCEALKEMTCLESLSITSIGREEIIQLEPISSSFGFILQSLRLRGRLKQLPNWIPRLKNLINIQLYWSKLTEDPLKMLQGLPNLVYLQLYNAYEGQKLHFGEGCFPKLKYLVLQCLSELREIVIEEGALSCVEGLTVGDTLQLKEVPLGIQKLRNLKTLYFHDMCKEFTTSVVPDEAPCRYIVEHVPSIFFGFATHGIFKEYYKLGDAALLGFLQI